MSNKDEKELWLRFPPVITQHASTTMPSQVDTVNSLPSGTLYRYVSLLLSLSNKEHFSLTFA
jgi:hypothetical protein